MKIKGLWPVSFSFVLGMLNGINLFHWRIPHFYWGIAAGMFVLGFIVQAGY